MAQVFGAASAGLGEYAGWGIQGAPQVTEVDYISILGSTGNQIGDAAFDTVYRLTQTYKAATSASTIPTDFQTIGNTVNSWIILGIKIDTDTADTATIEISAIQFVDGTANGTVRSVAHGMALDSGRGCSLWGCTATESNGGFRSSCNITCELQRAKGGTSGFTICAETWNPRIEISVTCTGDVTIATGFTQTSKTNERVNNDFHRYTTNGVKALAFS